MTTTMKKIPEDWAMRRRNRYIAYSSWCYHHDRNPMTWEEWKAAWNAGVIR